MIYVDKLNPKLIFYNIKTKWKLNFEGVSWSWTTWYLDITVGLSPKIKDAREGSRSMIDRSITID